MPRLLFVVAAQLAGGLAIGGAGAAVDPGAPPATVTLPAVEASTLSDPVEKSYRNIVRGMDLFERRRDLAPAAALRFKLLPRTRDTDMSGITLAIVGETVDIPVPIAADDTFSFARSQRALDEDAVVVPNRKARSMTWRTDIRTPGLPAGTRRLGDLRLECLVGVEAGLVSDIPSSLLGDFAGLIADRGYCGQRMPHYLFFAERPLWSVTLVHGDRREILPVEDMYAGIARSPMSREELQHCDCEVLLDRTYYAPLGDPRWPDDTLIRFEYMEEGMTATASSGGAPERPR